MSSSRLGEQAVVEPLVDKGSAQPGQRELATAYASKV